MSVENSLIVIAGPTGIGKSNVAIELSKRLNAEIVSGDCYQCYKEMDIGTAKPEKNQLSEVKHYMINVYSPDEQTNVCEFSTQARSIISKMIPNENIILVGGSGLYIDNIVFKNYNLDIDTVDKSYREYLFALAKKNGNEYLHDMLEVVDPDYAKLTHKNNLKRVVRALEFNHVSGRKISENKMQKSFNYENTFYFVLSMEREQLYERINFRVDCMIKNGLLNEVQHLMDVYGCDSVCINNTIGYSELISYIRGDISLDFAIEQIKQHTRNYAKRQYTWFRRNPEVSWIEIKSEDSSKDIAEKIWREINV